MRMAYLGGKSCDPSAIFAECAQYCSDQECWIRDDLLTIDSRSIFPPQSSQGSCLNW